MEYTLDQLASLVARHAPVFHLHPSDHFMPCSVEFFMQHSRLMAVHPEHGERVLLPLGVVTSEGLLEQQQLHPPPARLWLDLDPSARTGSPQAQIDGVPLYAHVKEVLAAPCGSVDSTHSVQDMQDRDSTAVEALEINYLTFYAYNGPYNVGGMRLIQTGAHVGDWEHITARVDPANGELLGMWYNAHRSRDGMWVEGHRVPRTLEGRPIAFVALHGHGVYPMAGTIPRHFFLGNDKTSSRGPLWRPATVVLLPPMHAEHAGHAGHAKHDGLSSDLHRSSIRLDQAPAASPEGAIGEALGPGVPGEAAAMIVRSSMTSIHYSVGSLDSAAAQQGSSAAASEAHLVLKEHRVSEVQLVVGSGSGADSSVAAEGAQHQGPGCGADALAQQLAEVQLGSRDPGSQQQEEQQADEPKSYLEGRPTQSAKDQGHLAAGGFAHCSGGSSKAVGVNHARPRTRRLHSAHSRGSSLSSNGGNGGSTSAGSELGVAAPLSTERGSTWVKVIVDDPCHWLFFRGLWGETDAPICQGWFHTAEPPLSRTTLLRLFGHFWPETRRV